MDLNGNKVEGDLNPSSGLIPLFLNSSTITLPVLSSYSLLTSASLNPLAQGIEQFAKSAWVVP